MITAGLILAAGAGRRFAEAAGRGEGDGHDGAARGSPKQLADLRGRPLLQWAVDAQTAVDPRTIGRIVVVLGYRAAEIRAAIGFGRAEVAVCEDWHSGQAASLRAGLQALAGADRIVVTLGDAPLVSAEVLTRFAGEPPGTRAIYDGRPGHPVVLGREHVAELLAAAGDRGARGLLRDARTIETGHLCSGRDIDTPEDLEEVRDEARAVI